MCYCTFVIQNFLLHIYIHFNLVLLQFKILGYAVEFCYLMLFSHFLFLFFFILAESTIISCNENIRNAWFCEQETHRIGAFAETTDPISSSWSSSKAANDFEYFFYIFCPQSNTSFPGLDCDTNFFIAGWLFVALSLCYPFFNITSLATNISWGGIKKMPVSLLSIIFLFVIAEKTYASVINLYIFMDAITDSISRWVVCYGGRLFCFHHWSNSGFVECLSTTSNWWERSGMIKNPTSTILFLPCLFIWINLQSLIHKNV